MKELHIGIIGFGTVGAGVVEAIQKNAQLICKRVGFTPIVKVVELGLLPRSEKKTKRVIDERFD